MRIYKVVRWSLYAATVVYVRHANGCDKRQAVETPCRPAARISATCCVCLADSVSTRPTGANRHSAEIIAHIRLNESRKA